MFYALLAALVKITALTFIAWRLWQAKRREAARADMWAEKFLDMRALHAVAAADGNLYRMQRDTARIRLQEIRETITRRPLRRRWLRIAHRVAGLADVEQRTVRYPA